MGEQHEMRPGDGFGGRRYGHSSIRLSAFGSSRQSYWAIEKLNLEIAGRVSQFGTWARLNLLDERNGRYEFRDGVDETKIEESIEDLAAAPQSGRNADRLYIHEILPDFATRNLISLYAELNLITRKAVEEGCHCKIDENQSSFIDISESKPAGMLSAIASKVFQHADDNRLRSLYLKMVQYREAEVALLSPAYLLQYNPRDHNTFIRSFQGIFLTEDTKRSGLPSTDCLENLPNGGSCISYADPGQSANGALGGWDGCLLVHRFIQMVWVSMFVVPGLVPGMADWKNLGKSPDLNTSALFSPLGETQGVKNESRSDAYVHWDNQKGRAQKLRRFPFMTDATAGRWHGPS
jgi:hypothetical protein